MKYQTGGKPCATARGSPPSRGAWIEIQDSFGGPIAIIVAPLAGGVD